MKESRTGDVVSEKELKVFHMVKTLLVEWIPANGYIELKEPGGLIFWNTNKWTIRRVYNRNGDIVFDGDRRLEDVIFEKSVGLFLWDVIESLNDIDI